MLSRSPPLHEGALRRLHPEAIADAEATAVYRSASRLGFDEVVAPGELRDVLLDACLLYTSDAADE